MAAVLARPNIARAPAASPVTLTVAATPVSRLSGSGAPISRAACAEQPAGAADPAFHHFAGVGDARAGGDVARETAANGVR